VLEAYALGKPVIGARIGGIPEIVEDGVTGFLFQPGNQENLTCKLTVASETNEADYKAMSDNTEKVAAGMFSPDSHYVKLMEIYKALI
jgi:glycosyltransferase involved in cell wall biosynthesis